jgi:uncharacterized protein involved in outer membrane biogenesis
MYDETRDGPLPVGGASAAVASGAAAAAAKPASASAGAAASAPASAAGKPVDSRYGIQWSVKGAYNNAPIRGSGKAGAVLRLQDTSLPFPLQADVRVGKTRIALEGTLTDPAHLAALDLQLRLAGASMANLYPLTGIVLPETGPFDTRGRLKGDLEKKSWTYEKFSGRMGSSDINGSLTFVAQQPRPKLSGEVVSNQLVFADLAPLIGADSNASKAERGVTVKQPADKVLPVEPFKTDRWDAIDADVKLTGRKIVRDKDLPINDLVTHLTLADGVLRLDPLNFGVAGGNLTSAIQLNGKTAPMQGTLQLRARGLKLKQLFPTFESMQASIGEINGDARLSATGNSVAALLGKSNGEVKLLVSQGSISKFLLEAAGLNVGSVIITKLFGDKQVNINCAVSDFAVTDGLAQARTFVVDTDDAVIDVSGAVNLAQETLGLTVRPDSKGVRIFSLRAPIYVTSTMKNPDVSIDKGVLALRAGGAIALGILAPVATAIAPLIELTPGEDSPCGKLLADIRKKPVAPPPGKRYKGKPAANASAATAPAAQPESKKRPATGKPAQQPSNIYGGG